MDDIPRESFSFADKSLSSLSKRKNIATIGFLVVIIIENIINQSTMVGLVTLLPNYDWLFLNFEKATAYTLAGFFYNAGKLLLIVPLSRLSDKIGRRKVITISFVFSLTSLIIIYFAQTKEFVYIGRLLFGFNSFVGVVTALIDDYYPEESRGKPLGYMSAAMLIGFLLGSLFGQPIFNIFGKYSFLFLEGIVVISLTIALFTIKDHPNRSSKKQKKLSDSESVLLRKTIRDPRYIGSLFINIFANLTFLGSGIYWNLIILDYFGITKFAGLWFLPPLVADLLTYLLVPILFRKKMDKVIFYACFAGIPASIILFIKPSLIIFTFAGVVFGILNSMVIQANDTISLYFIPKEVKGTAIGILKFFTIGAGTIGPLIFGLVVDKMGDFVPLIGFAIMLLVVGLIYWLLVYRNIRTRKLEAAI